MIIEGSQKELNAMEQFHKENGQEKFVSAFREKLTDELKKIMYDCGADLIGIGDMSEVENCNYKTGVSIAVALPKKIIVDLQTAPTKEYYDLYYSLNKKLNEIVMVGEDFLKTRGFEAYAQTTNRVEVNQNKCSKLPHKTVATRGGLGWIGKNGLLVTSQYGSAVRISSLLTNAPLNCDEPINQSFCGVCSQCVKNCPAQALKGSLWTVGMQREEIVNVEECQKNRWRSCQKVRESKPIYVENVLLFVPIRKNI